MIEGALLSLSGGLLGLWLAHTGVRALTSAYPASLPRTGEVGIDGSVLLFAFGVSAATAVLFGLGPTFHGHVEGLAAALTSGRSEGTTGAVRHRMRHALIVAEVALALILVLGAGLMIRTVGNLRNVDAGSRRRV